MSKSIAFIGSSCSHVEASRLTDAELRPAAARGDITKAVRDGADQIVLIDGRMVDGYPPSPREVYDALSLGVTIYGAASIGALRAVELPFKGMQGVGWVYQQYASRKITSDDELAVHYDPKTGKNLTIALVRVRYAAYCLLKTGEISQKQCSALICDLANRSYSNRTRKEIFEAATRAGISKKHSTLLLDQNYDIKKIDALKCLDLSRKNSQKHVNFFFENTLNETQLPENASGIDLLDQHLLGRQTELGISRLGDTTYLDRVGIPTYSCIKPATTDVIWVYSGKGTTKAEARVTAIMECIERTAALWNLNSVIKASESKLEEDGSEFWSPDRFTEMSNYSNTKEIYWSKGTNLTNGNEILVPAELVFSGMRPNNSQFEWVFSASTSNGLAASTSVEDAISRALAELIERDTVSCAELQAGHHGVLAVFEMARRLGITINRSTSEIPDNSELAVSVDTCDAPMEIMSIVQQYKRAKLDVSLKLIPNDFGVPVFGAAIVEELNLSYVLATAGYGANVDPELAAKSALLELAQSRATDLQGAREDCTTIEKHASQARPHRHWLATSSMRSIKWSDIKNKYPKITADEASKRYVNTLNSVGLKDIAVVKFPTFQGISAVRVLVPGIETWHPTAGESRLGPRMRKLLKRQ